MAIPPTLRFGIRSALSQAEEGALEGLSSSPAHEVSARRDLVREGETPRHLRLVLAGWACRYKTTREGKRQILGFLIPGDFCDLSAWGLKHMDHSVGAITHLRVAPIVPGSLAAVVAEYPRIARAIWRQQLIDASIQRQWLLNIGQRSAYERLGHLLAELFHRLRSIGLVDNDSCAFPPRQNDLADATGLTAVHVNRTLQELRRAGLLELDRKRLRLPDLPALIDASGFNPNYLHLDHGDRNIDAYA